MLFLMIPWQAESTLTQSRLANSILFSNTVPVNHVSASWRSLTFSVTGEYLIQRYLRKTRRTRQMLIYHLFHEFAVDKTLTCGKSSWIFLTWARMDHTAGGLYWYRPACLVTVLFLLCLGSAAWRAEANACCCNAINYTLIPLYSEQKITFCYINRFQVGTRMYLANKVFD